MSRVDQYMVAVSVDDEDLGVFDSLSGGNVDSEEQNYKPGGMAPPVALGGSQMTENVTVSRLYDLNRDHPIVKSLMAKAGKAVAVIKKQPLDRDGNPFGQPLVYRGVLKAVTPPDHDSEGTEAAKLELEFSVPGAVG